MLSDRQGLTADDVMVRSSASSGCRGNSVGANENQTFQEIKDRGLKLHPGIRRISVSFSTIWWPKNTLQVVLTVPDDLGCDFRSRLAASR